MGRLSELLGSFESHSLTELEEPEGFIDLFKERIAEIPEHLQTLGTPGGGTSDPRTMALTGMRMTDPEDPIDVAQKSAQTEAASELFATALGPVSVAAGEKVESATGSKLAGLLAEVGVGILEGGGVGKAVSMISGKAAAKQLPKTAAELVAKRATRQDITQAVLETPAKRAAKAYRENPLLQDIIEPDPDIILKQFPPPEKPTLSLPAGHTPEMLPSGAVQFSDMAEAAAAGHISSFRNAGTMLGQSSDEMQFAINRLSRDAKGHYVSNELRGETYGEYLNVLQQSEPSNVIQDILPQPVHKATLMPPPTPTEPVMSAVVAEPKLSELQPFGKEQAARLTRGVFEPQDPTEISPAIKAWMSGLSDQRIRSVAEGVKTGRPFNVPDAMMFQMETGLRKAFRLGGLSKTQQDQLIGLSKSNPGLAPHQRVLFARKWDEAIKPLVDAHPQKAKNMAKKLVAQAQEMVAQSKENLSKNTDELLVDPRVHEQLGGRSVGQVRHMIDNLSNELHEEVNDGLTMLSGVELKRYIAGLPKALNTKHPARKLRELRAATMLTRVGTHIRNLVSTAANIATSAAVVPTGALADMVRHAGAKAMGRASQRQIYAGEAMAQLVGWKNGLPEYLRAFGRNARAVRELVDPEKMSAFSGKMAKATTLSFKALAAEDHAMFQWAFSGEMYRVAYRKAMREGAKNPMKRAQQIINHEMKLPGALLDEAMKTADELTKKMDIDIDHVPTIRRELVHRALREGGEIEVDEALELAERSIFTAREGRRMDALLSAIDEVDQMTHGLGVSIVAPFRRTPANLMREAIRTSPIGIVTAFNRAAGGRGGARVLSQEIGRGVLGTGMIGAAMLAYKNGWLQLHPFDKGKTSAQRATEAAAGVMQDGMTFMGYSFPIDRLEPMGSLLLNAARAQQALDSGDEAGYVNMTKQLMIDFPKAMLREGFLEDFADLIDAMGDEHAAKKFARRLGMSFVPGVVPEMSRAFKDPIAREAAESSTLLSPLSGAAEAAQIRKGHPKVGLFGEEQQIGGPLSIATSRITKRKDDPLVNHMLEIGAHFDSPRTVVRHKGETLEFTPEEEYIFAKAKGIYQRELLTRVFAREAYHRLPPEKQRKLLENMYNKAGSRINKRVKAMKIQGHRVTHRKLLQGLLK